MIRFDDTCIDIFHKNLSQIIEAMCGGSVVQVCGSCEAEVIVRAFCPRSEWSRVMGSNDAGMGHGVVTMGPRGLKVSCSDCPEKVHDKDMAEVERSLQQPPKVWRVQEQGLLQPSVLAGGLEDPQTVLQEDSRSRESRGDRKKDEQASSRYVDRDNP